jgi:THO complex subunit 1
MDSKRRASLTDSMQKHFKQKSLIILRSCNELLRRLSRAEDTVFCGRVFIFLFQSFPLGDKSSVNLRGEFHTENVTTYDDIVKPKPNATEGDIAMTEGDDSTPMEKQADGTSRPDSRGTGAGEKSPVPKVFVSGDEKQRSKEPREPVDLDALYPVFWSLQAYFSAPTKLFDPDRLASFKAGLEATLSAFKNINTDLESQGGGRSSEEARKSHKRKRIADGPEVSSNFNPKYLTSRDLFDLEVSDTAFRRHVLVQALILLDFMLSLTPQAKQRQADLPNKSVLYGFVLSEDDAKWASSIRRRIEGYLRDGPGGMFYYRMVDTVLSRDKNWVRWKAEGCPPIERPAISVPDYLAARDNAVKTYANKRIRASPMGALDFKFLSDSEALANIERLKESDRFAVPDAKSIMGGILDDEMDIDMAQTADEKDAALSAKSSKTWRILRLSAKTKMAAFDKIDDGNNLNILFEAPAPPGETPQPEGQQDTAQNSPEAEGKESALEEAAQYTQTSIENTTVTEDTQQQESAVPAENPAGEQGPAVESSAGTGDNTKEESAT